MILVAGSTGVLGSEIVRRLLARGEKVRAMVRATSKTSASRAPISKKRGLVPAQPISATPGLLWKVWLINEKTREAGGTYLFESADAVSAM